MTPSLWVLPPGSKNPVYAYVRALKRGPLTTAKIGPIICHISDRCEIGLGYYYYSRVWSRIQALHWYWNWWPLTALWPLFGIISTNLQAVGRICSDIRRDYCKRVRLKDSYPPPHSKVKSNSGAREPRVTFKCWEPEWGCSTPRIVWTDVLSCAVLVHVVACTGGLNVYYCSRFDAEPCAVTAEPCSCCCCCVQWIMKTVEDEERCSQPPLRCLASLVMNVDRPQRFTYLSFTHTASATLAEWRSVTSGRTHWS